MTPGKTGFFRAISAVIGLASKDAKTPRKLKDALKNALDVVGGGRGFLVVSKPKDPFHIELALNFTGDSVLEREQKVSRELLRNAWDLGDAVVAERPFATLFTPRGDYDLKGNTLQTIPNLRSVIVVPLVHERKNLGALVLHENERAKPFTIFDRANLEPLAVFAAKAIAEGDPRGHEHARTNDQGGLVGSSDVWRKFLRRVEKAAVSRQNVLLVGETGTGKERTARMLHEKSRRAGKPFVVANMAALSAELIESELFGHVRGSFTGALADKIGLFEAAQGGTIFLDEMGELSITLQGRLLRVLEEKTIRSVGSTSEKAVDVRIVAATNRDLLALSNEGEFKLDVFMRLSGLELEVPPLRERASDIRELVPHIIEGICAEDGCEPKTLTEAAYKRLMKHDWPGNVRELENVLRDALVFSEERVIDSDDLRIRAKKKALGPTGTLTVELEQYIRACEALRETGDVDSAAKRLKRTRATFYRWLKHGKDFDPEGSLLGDMVIPDEDA